MVEFSDERRLEIERLNNLALAEGEDELDGPQAGEEGGETKWLESGYD